MTELTAKLEKRYFGDAATLSYYDGRVYVGGMYPDAISIPPDIRERLEKRESVRVDLVWKDE